MNALPIDGHCAPSYAARCYAAGWSDMRAIAVAILHDAGEEYLAQLILKVPTAFHDPSSPNK